MLNTRFDSPATDFEQSLLATSSLWHGMADYLLVIRLAIFFIFKFGAVLCLAVKQAF
jgi:hypothetical protein